MYPEAIKRRRQQHPEFSYLSDWQTYSAGIVASSIYKIVLGMENGPVYIPMPTGSGKTTGAIWGILDVLKDYPDTRICFLTPYQKSVNSVFSALSEKLGEEVVGHYHSDAQIFDKTQELAKQIVVLTHSFIPYNKGKLDDRDLFIVDEAIYATGEATLKLQHFLDARSWATSNNIMPDEFGAAYDYAHAMDVELRETDKKFIVPQNHNELVWAKSIANDFKSEVYRQSITQDNNVERIQIFCEALCEGLGFLAKGATGKDNYDPFYSAAVLGIPNLQNTAVLSATGGMLYDIAGSFKQDSSSKNYWKPPSFEHLTLVQLPNPDIDGHYSSWGRPTSISQAIRYVDWLLSEIPETQVYLTVPKKVLKLALSSYFGLPQSGEIELPAIVVKHGKTIHLSHHSLSIGSNDFKDCDAVIYLWDNHLPYFVSVQRFHTLADEPVTDEQLEDANSNKLMGYYRRIREAQYLDNMMQQIGRGNVRNIDNEGNVGTMSAYVLIEQPNRFVSLTAQYRDCQVSQLDGYIAVSEAKGAVARIVQYLSRCEKGQDIPVAQVQEVLNITIRKHKSQLENDWDLKMLGYEYKLGSKGRGHSAAFEWKG